MPSSSVPKKISLCHEWNTEKGNIGWIQLKLYGKPSSQQLIG